MLRKDKLLPLSNGYGLLLADIHQQCFEKPWNETFFTTLLNEQQTACPVFGWLYTDIQPAGFILARNQITQTEILTFAVKPDFQKQGIGTFLLERLLEQSFLPLFLEVAVDNQGAINLYRRQGFKIIGNRPNYYKNRQGISVDGYIMQSS